MVVDYASIPGPADEFQLTNFILLFKGTQFFTSGVIALFIGAMQYYRCYIFNVHDMGDCVQRHGPGAWEWLWGQCFDYFGSVLLVCIAFLNLPRSHSLPRSRYCEISNHPSPISDKQTTYCCCLTGVKDRGGRLRKLLMYDVCCFVTSFVVIFLLHLKWSGPHQRDDLRPAIYWSRVVYALFALPFSLFVLPVFFELLTHCIATGHNEHGACVEFAYRIEKPSEE